jgi:hypothetical protein
MDIIADAALTEALITEFRTGRKLMEARQQVREMSAAQEAQELKGKTHSVLGKALAVIPQHEYFLMRQKYGEECWHDKEFIKDFQKLEPTMKVHNA